MLDEIPELRSSATNPHLIPTTMLSHIICGVTSKQTRYFENEFFDSSRLNAPGNRGNVAMPVFPLGRKDEVLLYRTISPLEGNAQITCAMPTSHIQKHLPIEEFKQNQLKSDRQIDMEQHGGIAAFVGAKPVCFALLQVRSRTAENKFRHGVEEGKFNLSFGCQKNQDVLLPVYVLGINTEGGQTLMYTKQILLDLEQRSEIPYYSIPLDRITGYSTVSGVPSLE